MFYPVLSHNSSDYVAVLLAVNYNIKYLTISDILYWLCIRTEINSFVYQDLKLHFHDATKTSK